MEHVLLFVCQNLGCPAEVLRTPFDESASEHPWENLLLSLFPSVRSLQAAAKGYAPYTRPKADTLGPDCAEMQLAHQLAMCPRGAFAPALAAPRANPHSLVSLVDAATADLARDTGDPDTATLLHLLYLLYPNRRFAIGVCAAWTEDIDAARYFPRALSLDVLDRFYDNDLGTVVPDYASLRAAAQVARELTLF